MLYITTNYLPFLCLNDQVFKQDKINYWVSHIYPNKGTKTTTRKKKLPKKKQKIKDRF